jgi:ribA/ribD-fused uncharacterized protein
MIELKQYRDRWLFEKVDEHIGFYPREFFCLDNFSAFKVLYKGRLYSTVEHAYQAAKFFDTAPEVVEQIYEAYSSHDAKKIAQANKGKIGPKFDERKVALMEELLRLKVEQNKYVEDKLLATGDYLIVEDSPSDSFWGIGQNRDGQNMLGKLWMKIRDGIKRGRNLRAHLWNCGG